MTTIKTAIIGASGFLGMRLIAKYRQEFPDCLGTSFSRSHATLTPFDIRAPDLLSLRLEETDHKEVILASSLTKISYCEAHPRETAEVNVRGTLELVRQLGKTNLTTIFISSDHVFDGKSGNYDEGAPLSPLTEYGRQKALVESEIPNLTDRYLIVRLTKLYGTEMHDGTLLDALVSELLHGRTVKAASDQIMNPTCVDDVMSTIDILQRQSQRGIVHVCSPESLSRFALATRIAAALQVPLDLVHPVKLHELPGMEHYPLITTLRCSRVSETLPVSFLSIDDAIERVVSQRS